MSKYDDKKLISKLKILLAKVKSENNSLLKAEDTSLKNKPAELTPNPANAPKTISLDGAKTTRDDKGRLLVNERKLTSRLKPNKIDLEFVNDPQLKAMRGLLTHLIQTNQKVDDQQEVQDHIDNHLHGLRRAHAKIKGLYFDESTGDIHEMPKTTTKPKTKKEWDWKPSFGLNWLMQLSTKPLENAQNEMIEAISKGNFPPGKEGMQHKLGWVKRISEAKNIQDLLNIGKDHVLNPHTGNRVISRILRD